MINHQWFAIVFELAAFLLLFAALEVCSRKTSVRPETTRKLLHVGSGILTLAFPFVFVDLWPVALLSGGAALVLAAARFVRFSGVVGRVERASWGEFYFPLSVVILFWLSLGEHELLFVIPVLVLTLADTAGAVVGTQLAASAPKDGHTMLIVSLTHAINPWLYKLPYDPIKGFAPIAMIASGPMVLTVNPGLEAKSVNELIALAKAKPGQLQYASAGVGTLTHLSS